MIAPEPFFEPRGTPVQRIPPHPGAARTRHTVDLVTYPFGQRRVDAGLADLPLPAAAVRPTCPHRPVARQDAARLALALTALRRACRERYDAIHSHEEGGLIGVVLAAMLRVPHLYDMHSSLPQQLTNFAFSRSRVAARGVQLDGAAA